MKIRLPKIPIDGYTILAYMAESDLRVSKLQYKYHENTPWEESEYYKTYSSNGAVLLDDWMISVNKSLSGRVSGWHSITKTVNKYYVFHKKKDAIAFVIKERQELIKRREIALEELKEELKEFTREKP